MQSAIEKTFPKGSAERRAALVILAFLALRLALSAVFPMIADEAYAVVVSRYPTLSYFDHPPLGFDFARLSAWLFGSEASVIVRLPHVLMGSLSAWLIFLVTRRAFGSEAGFWAAAWYSVAPFFLISGGHFVVPDGPLNFFLLATLWLVLPDLLDDRTPHTRRWFAAGLALGAALLSKYTAALFGVAATAVLLATPRGRRVLASPGPWLALPVAALCLAPVLVWNLQNDWASFGFQSNRAYGGSVQIVNFLGVQLGQAGYLLPWSWAVALFMIARGLIRPRHGAERIFAALAVVPILVFDAISVFSREILPHWAMPGFLFSFPLLGLWCAEMRDRLPRAISRFFAVSAIGIPALAVLVTLQTNSALVTRTLGLSSESDFDWTILSWSALKEDFARRGILTDPDAYLVPTTWLVGGKAGYDLGPSLPVAPPVLDARHFIHMDDPRLPGRKKGYAVIAVWPGDSQTGIAGIGGLLASRYRASGDHWIVVQERAGIPAFEIVVLPVERF